MANQVVEMWEIKTGLKVQSVVGGKVKLRGKESDPRTKELEEKLKGEEYDGQLSHRTRNRKKGRFEEGASHTYWHGELKKAKKLRKK